MSGKFVRASKYRHVFGQAAKKELCYENLKVTKNAWDSNIINCNGKYLSCTWESSGGGAFAVIPVSETGKAPDTVPLFRGHKGPVLDTAFNPFDKQQIASCSDDGQILVWQIPEDFSFHDYRDAEDNLRDMTEPLKTLSGHKRKVGHVDWHPCAANVLASSSMDYTVKIWNTETGTAELSLQHNDLVTWFAFNYNGLLLATTSRDKKLRIWDLRTGKVIQEGASHTGAKASRVTWLGNTDRICTTGFSRLSDRQVGIWDVNNIADGPIDGFMVIDSSSGVLIPIFDDANSILYLAGKGDGNIRYYEYENDVLHEISQYSSTDAQRGFAAAPKTSVNMRENEILKSFKTVNDHAIEPISFIVPRKSELFQHDIYPDAASDKPALTAEEWFGGKDVNGPLLVSMEAIYEGTSAEARDSSPSVSISERKAEISAKQALGSSAKSSSPVKKVQAKAEQPSASPSPSPSVVSRNDNKKDTVDEVLKSSGKVDNLLNKVVDESDDEDSERIKLSKDQDEDWEEVQKPVEVKKAAKEEKPAKEKKTEPKSKAVSEPESKPEAQSKSKAETKTEKNASKQTKPETKEDNKAEKDAVKSETKTEKDAVKSETKTEKDAVKSETKTEKDAVKPDTKTEKGGVKSETKASAGQPTLRVTVDKLAALVESLERQVSTLVSANIEKNDKIDALEKKIDELLHR